MRRRMLLLLLVLLAALPALAEDPKPGNDGLVLERPKGVDEETWKRVKEGYGAEKEDFVRLLLNLEKLRIDYTQDTLTEILKKQAASDALLEEHRSGFAARQLDPELVALDYTAFLRETEPRLSGRVLAVGPGSVYPDIGLALSVAEAGDVIRLEEGTYAAHIRGSAMPKLTDVAIVGCGADKTTLSISLGECQRVRLQSLKIDCRDEPVIADAGSNNRTDSVAIEACTIMGYNTGQGGSDAITGTRLVLLVDGCTFEGLSGRVSANAQGGTAIDLRGNSLLYVRKTLFKDNSMIARPGFPCVFERCKATNATQSDSGVQAGSVTVFSRKSDVKVDGTSSKEFDHAVDDPEVVAFALGEKKTVDPLTKRLLTELKLDRSLPYWIGLLRNKKEAVRLKAARRLEALTGKKVGVAEVASKSVDDLARAVEDLGSADVPVRDKAIETLTTAGEAARALLEEAAENGTARVAKRASQVLATFGDSLPQACEEEYARFMKWFEEERSELVFEEKAGRWVKKP